MASNSNAACEPWIVDTTLRREGRGLAAIPDAERTAIALSAAAAGVGEIELGSPCAAREDMVAMRDVAALGLPCRLTAWCAPREEDIDRAALAGVDALHVWLPGSSASLLAMGMRRDWAIDRLARLVAFGLLRFDRVFVEIRDASRAEPDFLASCVRAAARAGAHRVRLADTLGVWSPLGVRHAFSGLRDEIPDLPLAFRGSDAGGMAIANAIAALECGAAAIDAAEAGDEAGIPALDALAPAVRAWLGIQAGIARDAPRHPANRAA